jgi:lipopolysaccharide export LptBFGC system permease protein LptF
LLSRYAFRTSADGRHFGSIIFGLIFAVLQIGLLINTILSYLAPAAGTFSPLVSFIFISSTANFIWLVVPLIYLIILGRSVADPAEV